MALVYISGAIVITGIGFMLGYMKGSADMKKELSKPHYKY